MCHRLQQQFSPQRIARLSTLSYSPSPQKQTSIFLEVKLEILKCKIGNSPIGNPCNHFPDNNNPVCNLLISLSKSFHIHVDLSKNLSSFLSKNGFIQFLKKTGYFQTVGTTGFKAHLSIYPVYPAIFAVWGRVKINLKFWIRSGGGKLEEMEK